MRKVTLPRDTDNEPYFVLVAPLREDYDNIDVKIGIRISKRMWLQVAQEVRRDVANARFDSIPSYIIEDATTSGDEPSDLVHDGEHQPYALVEVDKDQYRRLSLIDCDDSDNASRPHDMLLQFTPEGLEQECHWCVVRVTSDNITITVKKSVDAVPIHSGNISSYEWTLLGSLFRTK